MAAGGGGSGRAASAITTGRMSLDACGYIQNSLTCGASGGCLIGEGAGLHQHASQRMPVAVASLCERVDALFAGERASTLTIGR